MLLDIYKTVTTVVPHVYGPQQDHCPQTIASTLYGWRMWATEPSCRDILRHIMQERRGHENPGQMEHVVKALMQEPLYGDLVVWGKLSRTLLYSRATMEVTLDRGPHRYVWNTRAGENPEDLIITEDKGLYTWTHPQSEWKALYK
jgi:hypothetical protein